MAKLAGPTEAQWSRPTRSGVLPVRTWAMRMAGLGVASVATLAVLAVVPVPSGAARLTLPTFIENAGDVPRSGGLAGPTGDSRDADSPLADPGSDRAPAGQSGGYTGFAETMDTSVRGGLSDEIVMRVRAPEPDFWRGQTFAEFDGRSWHADPDIGTFRPGPNIDVPAGLGDISLAEDVVVDRFVQTYFLATDMPNVIFHASRPRQVVVGDRCLHASGWRAPRHHGAAGRLGVHGRLRTRTRSTRHCLHVRGSSVSG